MEEAKANEMETGTEVEDVTKDVAKEELLEFKAEDRVNKRMQNRPWQVRQMKGQLCMRDRQPRSPESVCGNSSACDTSRYYV